MEQSKSPATATTTTKAAMPKACDACRRRKLKCPRRQGSPSESPSDMRCLRCQRTNIRCTYNDEFGKKGPRTGRRLEAIRASQALAANSSAVIATPDNDASQPHDLLPNDSFSEQSPVQFDLSFGEDDSASSIGHLDGRAGTDSTTSNLDTIQPSWERLALGTSADILDRVLEEHNVVHFSQDQLSVAAIESTDGVAFSWEDIVTELALFCLKCYQRHPIIHLETVLNRIERGDHVSDPAFRTMLLSIFLVNEASQFRHYPDRSPARLDLLSRATEKSRANSPYYHFADSPSLDTVISSLFLFIAYSVRDKHNRAFIYLAEAIGLMDLVKYPCDRIEIVQYHRIECLLFVTEAASNSIYGTRGKRRLARNPSSPPPKEMLDGWYISEHKQKHLPPQLSTLPYESLDKRSAELLYAMTRLHSALDTAGVSSVEFQDDILATLSNGDDHKPSCLFQTADVAVTRQWKLATHWWHALSENGYSSEKKENARYIIQIIGMTAVQRTKFLHSGACRIVGHGKLAALADTMFKISSALDILPCCSSLIRDMIHIVSKADCEGSFAPGLSLIQICIEEVPRPVTSAHELEYDGRAFGNTDVELFPSN
ncbi:hypothetical protein GGI42DRAFT_360874 [Trichoderma sp. SZMC 28013]